jgi:hypothetical protein
MKYVSHTQGGIFSCKIKPLDCWNYLSGVCSTKAWGEMEKAEAPLFAPQPLFSLSSENTI